MTTQELMKEVRRIEIRAKGLTEQVFSGGYKTNFKGRGMSFSEVREYQYGDDVRNIDWNVTARTHTPHVKVFEEERELTIMLLIDVSGSAFFGNTTYDKHQLSALISATLAFSAIHNGDKVGALFFSDEIEQYLPPQKGKGHVLRIIRECIRPRPPKRGTDLNLPLRYAQNLIRKRASVFLLSDFMAADYEELLKTVSRRHDLIGIQVYAPFEANMPDVGLIPWYDAETGASQWVDTSAARVRKAHNTWFAKHTEAFKQAFRHAQADTLQIATDEDYVMRLKQFFARRPV